MKKDQVVGSPAGFWVRMAAQIIDSLVFWVTLPVVGILAAILVPQIARHFSVSWGRWLAVCLFLGGFLGLPCLYSTLMTAFKGQTMGKMLFNLKVVQTDGEPLSVFRSFFRWLSYFLSAIPLGLGYLFPVFQKDKRALHDMVCGTRVVQTGPTNQVALILVLCLTPFVGAFFGGMLAAIAIPRFAQMLEKSREGSTKGNLGALKKAIAIYQADQGKWPQDLEKDMVGKYIDIIPPVKATGAFVANGKSPAGNQITLGAKGQVPTESGSGWLYDGSLGKVYVNSTVKDSKGVPYSFYGFE
jgi:uncharacterized RDD family membrane protein YckC